MNSPEMQRISGLFSAVVILGWKEFICGEIELFKEAARLFFAGTGTLFFGKAEFSCGNPDLNVTYNTYDAEKTQRYY